MRSYKEIADIVREQGDAILERRRIRAQRIKKISCAVSGLCAAVIVGVAVWHNSSLKNDPDFGGNNIISASSSEAVISETSAEAATSATAAGTTAAKTARTEKTTTVSSTSAAAAVSIRTTAAATQNSEVKVTAVMTDNRHTAVTNIPATTFTAVHSGASGRETVSTGSSAEIMPVMTSISAIPETPVTTSTVRATTSNISTTSAFGADTPTTRPVYTTIDIKEAFLTSYCTVTLKSVTYEKTGSLVPENWIGIYIGKFNVRITVSDEAKPQRTMEVYEIADVSAEEEVAVKLLNTDEYYLFRNIDRKKEEFAG